MTGDDMALMSSLIGSRYVKNGKTPDEGFDCYSFLSYIYSKIKGVDLPDYTSIGSVAEITDRVNDGICDWKKVPESEGVAVLMSGTGADRHIGYCIGGGKFIHCEEGSGVRVDRIGLVRSKIIGFYKYERN